jgi:hypothetical protein
VLHANERKIQFEILSNPEFLAEGMVSTELTAYSLELGVVWFGVLTERFGLVCFCVCRHCHSGLVRA